LQIAEDAARAERSQAAEALRRPLPMVPVQPRTPQQLSLFSNKEAPRPSRAEGLRRGVGERVQTPEVQVPLTVAQRRAQVPLFTQEGQPSVAALKSAAPKQQVAAPVPETGTVQTPPTGKKVTPASVAKAKAEVEVKEAEQKEKVKKGVAKLKEKKDAVQEPSTEGVDADQQPGDGKAVRVGDAEERQPAAAPAPQESKVEAKAEADQVAGPVAITLELGDGTKVKTKDAAKLLQKVDDDISKFEALLDCLKKAL